MRILVTGASGLLGLNLALEASAILDLHSTKGAQKRYEVYGLVNHQPLRTNAFEVLQADLLTPGTVERIMDQIQPEVVIHCAALANIDACESSPVQAYELNKEIPRKLASYVARGGARLIHISTDAVFDGVRGDYTENDTPNPLSIYARSKLEGEEAVLSANPQALVARVNLFGWSLRGTRSLSEFFFYNLRAGKRVPGFTDVYFCPILANDLAQILLRALQANLTGLYHMVSSECTSKFEFGKRLASRFGLDASLIDPASWKEAGLNAVRSPNLSLRSDKAAAALGNPLPDLSSGLDHLFVLYQQNYPQQLNEMGKIPSIS